MNMQGRAQGIFFAKEISLLPLAFFLALQPANALTTKDIEGLTYSQIKGTGIANRCPEASSTGKEQEITLDSGTKYKLVDFCLEPKSFQVEQETEKRKGVFVKGEHRAMHTLHWHAALDGADALHTRPRGVAPQCPHRPMQLC
jgi:hypothetical protein